MMRYLNLPLLLILPISVLPTVVRGADARPKAAVADQPAGGADSRQAAADQDFSGDRDADKADSDNADSDKAKRPKTGSRPTSMAITPEQGGLKTLTIHFRWSLYPNASIEMRLLPNTPEPKATGMAARTKASEDRQPLAGAEIDTPVAPVYFSEHLKGKVQEALFTCLDHPGEGGRTYSFTKDKIVYKLIGCRNSLGNQGVHVQVQPENSRTPDKKPAAAYLQLDTWAVNQETLSLDLARDEFAKPGMLTVWFFRGDQVVWEEQVRWPGYGAK